MKKNHADVSGKNNPMFGKHHSEETKKKISLAKKGKSLSKDTIEKIRKAGLGKHHSEETKEKMSKSHKGKKFSLEHKRKLSEFMKKNNPMLKKEYREKISKALSGKNNPMYGKHHSEETIERFKKVRTTWKSPMRDSSIELKLQEFLSKLHIEFVTHKYVSEISHKYQCDIFIPKQETEDIIVSQKTIIEADGCFWHGCEKCKKLITQLDMERQNRDKIRTQELKEQGFRVIRLWEHEINKMELTDFQNKMRGVHH